MFIDTCRHNLYSIIQRQLYMTKEFFANIYIYRNIYPFISFRLYRMQHVSKENK